MPTRLTPSRAMTLIADGDPVECRIVLPGADRVATKRYTREAIEVQMVMGVVEFARHTAASGFGLMVRTPGWDARVFVRTKPDIDWARELAEAELEQEGTT